MAHTVAGSSSSVIGTLQLTTATTKVATPTGRASSEYPTSRQVEATKSCDLIRAHQPLGGSGRWGASMSRSSRAFARQRPNQPIRRAQAKARAAVTSAAGKTTSSPKVSEISVTMTTKLAMPAGSSTTSWAVARQVRDDTTSRISRVIDAIRRRYGSMGVRAILSAGGPAVGLAPPCLRADDGEGRQSGRQRSRSRSAQANRKLIEAAEHEPVAVGPAQLAAVDGEAEVREAAEQRTEGDA